jgi:hypothetical protein
MYHNNAMTINKYVEAERRTTLGERFDKTLSSRLAIAASSEKRPDQPGI